MRKTPKPGLIVSILILVTVCGKVRAIIGGEDGRMKTQVSITGGYYHHCSGTILDDGKILTSAHCVEEATPEELTVVAGVTDIQAWKDGRSDRALVLQIEKITTHPDYIPGNFDFEHRLAQSPENILFFLGTARTFQKLRTFLAIYFALFGLFWAE